MSKLFLITMRWLARDKKRTVLTAVSIMLSVYLIVFVGTYMSTFYSVYGESLKYNQGYAHGSIYCDSIEQAEQLMKNTAFEQKELSCVTPLFISDKFVEKYKDMSTGGDNDYFPLIYINGENIFENEGFFKGAVISGDTAALEAPINFSLEGGMPDAPDEAAVSAAYAKKYGIDINDTVTIRYEVRKGSAMTAKTDEEGNLIKDENGELEYTEDTDGSRLNEIYNELFSSTYIDPEGSNYVDQNYVFSRMYYPEPRSGRENNIIVGNKSYSSKDPFMITADLSDETAESFEITVKVTGIADNDNWDIGFDKSCAEVMPFFEGLIPKLDVRVKEGLDAEQIIADSAKAAGLDPETGVNIKAGVLISEGRQLEYLANIGGLMLAAVVIMAMFVFLARLIINNAFEISAAYRTEQYGALKTVGASDKQIFVMIMFECLLYIIAALPLGTLGAWFTAKQVLKKIIAVKMFDPIYGEGVSDGFFKLNMSSAIMLISVFIALFSVFFSAYADAMRVRRMSPIQSANYRTSKQRRSKRHIWLSKKIFGYPFGFAVKSISRQRVRFAVTLLATVLSGVFFISVTGIADTFKEKDVKPMAGDDFTVNIEYGEGEEVELVKNYEKLKATGYFNDIFPFRFVSSVCGGEYYSEEFKSTLYTKDYRELMESGKAMFSDGKYCHITVTPIGRDEFDRHVTADISYDELKNSGKLLLNNDAYLADVGLNLLKEELGDTPVREYSKGADNYAAVLDVEAVALKGDFTLEMTSDMNVSETEGEPDMQPVTDTLEFAGTYSCDAVHYINQGEYMTAIIPVENYEDYINALPSVKYNTLLRHSSGISFYLGADESRQADARKYLADEYEGGLEDYTLYKAYKRNAGNVISIAGYAFAGVLIAVALLNIFSTMNANMINRRRDYSMMRSCGMSMKQVVTSLLGEGLIYGVISALVSGLLGWVITYGVSYVIGAGDIPRLPLIRSVCVLAAILLVMALSCAPALVQMYRGSVSEEIRHD